MTAKLWQVQETLSDEVLQKMHAPPKGIKYYTIKPLKRLKLFFSINIKAADVPVIQAGDLKDADGFIFGVPTRFGI